MSDMGRNVLVGKLATDNCLRKNRIGRGDTGSDGKTAEKVDFWDSGPNEESRDGPTPL